MTGPEILALMSRLPVRGRLVENAPLADVTWFRVGGPADVLFLPADEDDLSAFLASLPTEVPVTVVGLGSNLLARDGGIDGVVIRLGKGFFDVKVEPGHRLRAGTAIPDQRLSKAAADAGISGLAFYRGIPGALGGALRMNAGAHGTETKDRLVEVLAVDRQGKKHTLSLADLEYTYRHCGAPSDLIFTEALFQGESGDPAAILAEMDEVAAYRETHQPVKARTGGSTFKNPPGLSAWRLIDEAGMRGFRVGDAVVSEKHCNFLINEGAATGEDVERLGEIVRARVRAKTGIVLDWEIIRLGRPLPGRPAGEALALTAGRAAI